MIHNIWGNDFKAYTDMFEDLKISDEYMGMSDEELSDFAWEMLDNDFDDTRSNLEEIDKNIPCGKIVAISDLGLWDGHHKAYETFDTLVETLYSNCEYNSYYVEDGNYCSVNMHHDGTNYSIYYIVEDYDEWEYEDNPYSEECFKKYFKPLGKYFDEYYGW